jgi:hypothetical protein
MSDDYADGGVHSLTQGITELTTILAGAARRSQVGTERGERAGRPSPCAAVCRVAGAMAASVVAATSFCGLSLSLCQPALPLLP